MKNMMVALFIVMNMCSLQASKSPMRWTPSPKMTCILEELEHAICDGDDMGSEFDDHNEASLFRAIDSGNLRKAGVIVESIGSVEGRFTPELANQIHRQLDTSFLPRFMDENRTDYDMAVLDEIVGLTDIVRRERNRNRIPAKHIKRQLQASGITDEKRRKLELTLEGILESRK